MSNTSSFYLILGLILIILSGAGGYFVGSTRALKASPQQIAQNAAQNGKGNSIIKQQTATLQGKITSVADNTITVVDEQNQSDQFSLSDRLVVYKPINNTQAGASTDIKDIQTNTTAFIVLELMDGKYQVVSISYPPDISELPPPPATPSAQR